MSLSLEDVVIVCTGHSGVTKDTIKSTIKRTFNHKDVPWIDWVSPVLDRLVAKKVISFCDVTEKYRLSLLGQKRFKEVFPTLSESAKKRFFNDI